jgi:hypothetical protein
MVGNRSAAGALVVGIAICGCVVEFASGSRSTARPSANGAIAYVTADGTHLVERDATNDRLFVGSGRFPAWSPDGTRLAVTYDSNEITIAQAVGSNERLISLPDEIVQPRAHPRAPRRLRREGRRGRAIGFRAVRSSGSRSRGFC